MGVRRGRIGRRGALLLGGGAAISAVAGATATAVAADAITLVVVSANIGRKRLPQRLPSIRRVRDISWRPVVGWQEINEGDVGERDMIDDTFGPFYNNAFLRSSREPISIPKPWVVEKRWITDTHRGIPKWSPSRSISETLVRHDSRPDLKFVLLNTHYIANAWNGRTDPLQDERRAAWNKHFRIHRERVAAWHAKGRLVIWTGDVNRRDMPKVHGDERRAFSRGIDRIGWVPGTDGVGLSLQGTRTVDLTVDSHDAKVATFRIRLTS